MTGAPQTHVISSLRQTCFAPYHSYHSYHLTHILGVRSMSGIPTSGSDPGAAADPADPTDPPDGGRALLGVAIAATGVPQVMSSFCAVLSTGRPRSACHAGFVYMYRPSLPPSRPNPDSLYLRCTGGQDMMMLKPWLLLRLLHVHLYWFNLA